MNSKSAGEHRSFRFTSRRLSSRSILFKPRRGARNESALTSPASATPINGVKSKVTRFCCSLLARTVQNETVGTAAYQYSGHVPRLSTSKHSQQTEIADRFCPGGF